jgi:aspartyl-tRNA(Asn)/glutamyl-tRNA(Gln) amidotransferase subunit C
MSLTRADIDHIAKLARLELSDAEKDAYAAQLSSVLAYVGDLGKADVEGVEPMAHVLKVADVLRDDAVRASTGEERAALLANFPAREGDLLKVPAVFG